MLEQASHWTVPEDLRPPLHTWLERQLQRWQQQPLPPLTLSRLSPSAFTLLHDLCQVLAFARQQPQAIRYPRRFPTPAHKQILRSRLLAPSLGENRQTEDVRGGEATSAEEDEHGWLRFLGQLATATGLLRDGVPQPLLWDWLQQPAAEQLRSLWQAWLDGDAAQMSTFFQQPSLAGVGGWRTALAGLANEQQGKAPGHFSAVDLCHRLLALPAEHPQPYRHWFAKLSAMDEQLGALLQAYLLPWGVVEVATQQAAPFLRPVDAETVLPLAPTAAEVCYRISDLGRFLLLSQPPSALGWQWQQGKEQWLASIFEQPTEPPHRSARPTVVWTLVQHSQGAPGSLVLVAPFCATIMLEAANGTSAGEQQGMLLLQPQADALAGASAYQRRLIITSHSLAFAASQGYGIADLWYFVQQSGLSLRPGDWKALQHALEEGNRIALRPALLLQTENAELMHQIQQTTALQPFLDEMLTPTLATWQGDRTAWITQLHKAGFFPFLSADRASPDVLAVAATNPDQSDELLSTPATLALPVAEAAVLWLALQVYERVGRYARLPLRAAPETMRHLLDALSATQQGSLMTQLQEIEAALASAIDQLPFTPPKAPSDPATWRALINQAIDQRHDLNLLHWSAGRGLAVQRRLTPFYIDEQRFGGPALRAWCHDSGRDLWFRLDRIQTATLLLE